MSVLRFAPHILQGRFNLGWCSICEARTLFVEENDWLRDNYRCIRCDSIPRWRAIAYVLEHAFPNWRHLRIHESSPGGASSAKLERECPLYTASHFLPHVPRGGVHEGWRCEDLEWLTFPAESVDLVVTQDVFEHVLDPARAFREVARVLSRGGAHVFTVPLYRGRQTFVRAQRSNAGTVEYLAEKDFHANPVDPDGSLVVTEWGDDLPDFVRRHSGLDTTVHAIRSRWLGLDGEFLEVFVSRNFPDRVIA